MKKLEWYKDTEGGWVDTGVDEADVWKATYTGKEGTFDLEVYPVKLLNKNAKGWEYKIIEIEPDGTTIKDDGFEYDAAFDSSNGNDHAPNYKVAMKWAENTLEDILEERKAKNNK